ncbi:unnamed protein product [Caenorhabditis brenneri]
MEQIIREIAERKDEEEEERMERKIRKLHDLMPVKLEEAIRNAQTQHMEMLKRNQTEQENFTREVERMKKDELKKHVERKAELLKGSYEKLSSTVIQCDGFNKTVLDNLEHKIEEMKNVRNTLEKQIAEVEAKNAEIVEAGKELLNEVDAQLQKSESKISAEHCELDKVMEKRKTFN